MSRGAGLVSYSDSSGEEGGGGKVEEEEEDSEEGKSPPRKKQCRVGKQKQVQKCFLLYIKIVPSDTCDNCHDHVFVLSKRVEFRVKGHSSSFLLAAL